MSISKREIMAENSRWICASQAMVEGVLKLPDSMEEISGVLDIAGVGEVTDASAGENSIFIEGNAVFCVLYLNKKGEFESFNATCRFNHTAQCEGVRPDMKVAAGAKLGEVSFSVLDGSSVSVRADICIDAFALGNQNFEILDPELADGNIHLKCGQGEASFVECVKMIKSYVKSELRVPQSMPEVRKVLAERGYAAVRGVVTEPGKAIIEGELRVFVVYESTDKNAPLQYFQETIPFGEIVNHENIGADSAVTVHASLERLAVDTAPENPDLLEISAVVNLCVMSRGMRQLSYIADLYDEKSEMEAQSCEIGACKAAMREGQKKIVRLEAQIPENAPEVSRVLFTAAVPKSVCIHPGRDRASIDGKLAVNICYTTADAGIKSASLVLPFETEISLPGVTPNCELQVYANVEYATAEGSGRELSLKCCLDLCIWQMQSERMRAVCEVSSQPLERPCQSGAVIYYADGGKTLWDIAKRFKVSSDMLGSGEPDAVVPKGERLIFIRK